MARELFTVSELRGDRRADQAKPDRELPSDEVDHRLSDSERLVQLEVLVKFALRTQDGMADRLGELFTLLVVIAGVAGLTLIVGIVLIFLR